MLRVVLLFSFFIVALASVASQQVFSVGGVDFVMVNVDGGAFSMGCDNDMDTSCSYDESPVHQVTLNSFLMSETEVTQALWKVVMRNNPSMFKGDSLPVENITYDEVMVFLFELRRATGQEFRLPTEAEWEYAARGGIKSHGYRYSGGDNLDEVAWHKGNSNVTTHPVKEKKPNELGLYDMSGNVREWCSDWKGSYGSAALVDPTGPEVGSRRVYRGGSWYTEADQCRVSSRKVQVSSPRSSGLGFRMVLIPAPK